MNGGLLVPARDHVDPHVGQSVEEREHVLTTQREDVCHALFFQPRRCECSAVHRKPPESSSLVHLRTRRARESKQPTFQTVVSRRPDAR